MRDKPLIFSDEQAVTDVGANPSSDSLDLTTELADVGVGTPVFLNIEVHTTVTSGGSATVAFSLQHSTDNSSFATKFITDAIGKASLTAGKRIIRTPLPAGLSRYVRVAYTVGTAALTAGKFNAYLDL